MKQNVCFALAICLLSHWIVKFCESTLHPHFPPILRVRGFTFCGPDGVMQNAEKSEGTHATDSQPREL